MMHFFNNSLWINLRRRTRAGAPPRPLSYGNMPRVGLSVCLALVLFCKVVCLAIILPRPMYLVFPFPF